MQISIQFTARTTSTALDKTIPKSTTAVGKKTTEEDELEEVWRHQKVDVKLLPGYYMRLAKIRLTG